jgi:hypothetical protein
MAIFILSAWVESAYDTLTWREQVRPGAQMRDEQWGSYQKVKCSLSLCLRDLIIDYTAPFLFPLSIKLLLLQSYQPWALLSAKGQA